VLDATALVDGRRVAAATLEYALESAEPGTEGGLHAERLRALARELQRAPAETATGGGDE
jgi:hypothetical protein